MCDSPKKPEGYPILVDYGDGPEVVVPATVQGCAGHCSIQVEPRPATLDDF